MKNNSKNGQLEVSLAFHSKDIEKINLLNDSTYKNTSIHHLSYTAVDPSESFIAIKNLYSRPRCGRHEQTEASNLVD